MRRIKLIYWHTNIENYGDLLSPYVVRKLSDCDIIHKNYYVGNWKSHLYHLIKEVFRGDFSLNCNYLFPFESNIVGIGSILFSGNKKSKIWGAGFKNDKEKCLFGEIYAVRGYCSLNKIYKQIQEGYPIRVKENVTVGDPALLLPMFISPSSKVYKIGIIPHFSEYDYFLKNYGRKYHIINLKSSDVEAVTKEITSCEYIVSSSLHGLIVAHTYGIPALWMENSSLEGETNGLKFRDYFSSVGIVEYEPIRDVISFLSDEANILRSFEEGGRSVLPAFDIEIIRQSLLSVAPFPINRNSF